MRFAFLPFAQSNLVWLVITIGHRQSVTHHVFSYFNFSYIFSHMFSPLHLPFWMPVNFLVFEPLQVHRPHVGTDPFSTELVLERGNADWFLGSRSPNLLQTKSQNFSRKFSCQPIFLPPERPALRWGRAKNKTFLYPVHASRSFLQTPTLASALYVSWRFVKLVL